MLNNIMTLVGYLTIFLICASLCFLSIMAVLDKIQSILSERDERSITLGMKTKEDLLRSNAIWFSEHEPTYFLICALARDNYNASNIREEWRKKMNDNGKNSKF